jgi:hypothetical protein
MSAKVLGITKQALGSWFSLVVNSKLKGCGRQACKCRADEKSLAACLGRQFENCVRLLKKTTSYFSRESS